MKRVNFSEIRAAFLDCYYGYCTAKIHHGQAWQDGEHEIGYAYEQYELAYDLPIEQLMLEVIALVLGGRRWPVFDDFHRQKIDQILQHNVLQQMMSVLDEEERRDFEADLHLLGITATVY